MRGDPPARARGHGGYEWMAEAAIASVTVASGVGMTRLFVGTSFLRDSLAMGLASHLVAAATRRARLSTLVAAPLSGLCLVTAVTVLRYRDTGWLVLPTTETIQAARAHLTEGWSVASASPSPVEAVPGLVLMTGVALWVAAFMADTTAFRARGSFSALAPGAGFFAFTAVAGVGDGRVRHAALFCATAAAALLALRLRDRRREAWIEVKPGRGARAMGRAGVAAGSAAVFAGVILGPMLPGAQASPWVDVGGLDADQGSRVVLSPLVQVRSRLVETPNQELFTMAVPEESRQYWRLMSLDDFDGSSWRARSQFEDARGLLAPTLDPSAAGPSMVQTVSLSGLGGDYLPAAHELRRVLDDGGVSMQYEAASGALIKSRRSSLDGPASFIYTVESVLPSITDPDVLRTAGTTTLGPGFLSHNTQLPDEVSDLVRDEAERVTAGASSDYRRALDLQDYFWVDGRFSYDLNVERNRGIEDLEDFLFDARAGYCEQFASAYAAMARSVGLPTRVAVGFTWGEWDPARGAYVVRGEHAHAWPEVFFAGTGWVRFEPTPGRGAPDDFAVTGRVADQAEFDPVVRSATSTEEVPAPGSSIDSLDGSGFAGRSPSDDLGPQASREFTGGAVSDGVSGPMLLGAAALVGLSLILGLVPGLRLMRRRGLRARLAHDPAGLVEVAWSDALGALELIGLGPRPSDTPLEVAARVLSVCPTAGPVDDLAVLATRGRYAKDTTADNAMRASILSSRVVGSCRRQASLRRRVAAALNPVTVFG